MLLFGVFGSGSVGAPLAELAVALEAESSFGVWTDIATDLIKDSVRWSRGIFGSGPFDRLARPGHMTFALDNTAQNSARLEHYYTPGHVNAPLWWRHGTRVRLRLAFDVEARYVFCGRLRSIKPDPPITGLQVATCLALDWMNEFEETDAIDLKLQKDKRADELLTSVIAAVSTAPIATDFDLGLDVYPFAFDDLGGGIVKAPQVAQDILQSDLGYLYVRGDETGGETVRFEGRHARASIEPLYTFELTDLENAADVLDVPSTLEHVYNDVEVLTVPRRLDTDPNSVLIKLDLAVEVAPGQTERLFVDYKDPNNEAVFIGGDDMQPLEHGTDWTANTVIDGTGTDVGADFLVVATYFGSRAMISLTNFGAVTGYVRGPAGLSGLQARGKGLYRYREVSSRATNTTSIAELELMRALPQPLLMPYQSDRNIGFGVAQYLAAVYGGVLRVPQRVRIGSDSRDPALLTQAVLRDIGDPIAVPVDDEPRVVFIHGVEAELTLDGRLRATYTVAPGDPANFFILDDPEFGLLDTGGVLGYA